MTSDYSRSYTLTRREQGPSSPLRSLFAAKLVGRWGDGPRFAGGADANFGILSNSRFGAVFEFYLYPIKVKLGKIDLICMSYFVPRPPKNRKKMANGAKIEGKKITTIEWGEITKCDKKSKKLDWNPMYKIDWGECEPPLKIEGS